MLKDKFDSASVTDGVKLGVGFAVGNAAVRSLGPGLLAPLALLGVVVFILGWPLLILAVIAIPVVTVAVYVGAVIVGFRQASVELKDRAVRRRVFRLLVWIAVIFIVMQVLVSLFLPPSQYDLDEARHNAAASQVK